MKKSFTLSVVLYLIFMSCGAMAQTAYYSQKNGLWNDPTMWNTAANGSGSFVLDPNSNLNAIVIQSGHSVVLNKSRLAQNITIQPNAQLSNGIYTRRRLILHGALICDGILGNTTTPDSISIEAEGANCSIGGVGSIDVLSIKKQDNLNTTTNLIIDANVVLHDVGGVLSNSKKNTNFNVTLNTGKMLTALGSGTVGGDVCIDGGDGTNGDERGGTFDIKGRLIIHGKLYLTTDNILPLYPCAFKIGGTGIVEIKDEMTCDSSSTAGHTFVMAPNAELILSGGGNVIDNFAKLNNIYAIDPAAHVMFTSGLPQSIEDDLNYPRLTLSGSGSIKTMKGNVTHRGVLEIMPNVSLVSPNEKADIKILANIINNGTIGTLTDSVSIDAACAACSVSGVGGIILRKISKKGDINPITNLMIDADIVLKGTNGVLHNDKINTLFNININANKTVNITQGNAGIDIAEAQDAGYTPREMGGKWLIQGKLMVGGVLYLTTDNALAAYTCQIQTDNGGTLQTNQIKTDNSGAGGHSFWVKSGGLLDIKGNFGTAAMLNNQYIFDTNSTTQYSGSAPNQPINAQMVYGNMVLDNSHKILADNTMIKGNLNIGSSASIGLGTYTLNLGGNLAVATPAVGGVAAGTGKIIFDGTTTQTVSAVANALTLHNIEINNAANVHFTTNVLINNILKFIQGNLTHATAAMPTLSPTAATTGSTPNTTIQGSMYLQTTAAATHQTPAWSSSGINITITPRTATPTTYEINTINATPPTANPSTIIKRTATTEYITIARTAGTAEGKIAFNWTNNYQGITNINNISKLEIAQLQNNTWNPASTPTQRTGTMQNGTLQTDYLDKFGTFAIGANVGVLPVQLIYFDAKQRNETIILDWATATETNNSHFDIQRRTPQNPNYETIATTQGNGTINITQKYTYTDYQPTDPTQSTQKETIIYRLIQNDFDGKTTPSNEATVYYIPNINKTARTATTYIYQNTLYINIQNNTEPITYQLIDMHGRTIDAKTINNNTTEIIMENLPHSIFLLKLSTDTEQFFIQKIIH